MEIWKTLKKHLTLIYFIFFIILNVIDFLNIIPNDLDLFKKFLSWFLIGLLIYDASITKILIGKRYKTIDFLFVLFSFIMIDTRTLYYWFTYIVDSNQLLSYRLFSGLITFFLSYINSFNKVLSMFYIGLSLLFILSYEIYKRRSYSTENSLYRSFNFGKGFINKFFSFLFIYFFVIFFSLTVYNFFMEWFALAVDSLILVLGLLYYIYVFIKRHIYKNQYELLNSISSSGEEIYLKTLGLFSNKKTLFLGISFLLTLHLLVDAGVFLIPEMTGLKNTLYHINSANDTLHIPLINFFNLGKSVLWYSIYNLSGKITYILSFIVILSIIIINLIFVSFSLILPSYILYSLMVRRRINIKSTYLYAYFLSFLFYIFNLKTNVIYFTIFEGKVLGVNIITHIIPKNISTFSLVLSIILVILYFISFSFLNYIDNILVSRFIKKISLVIILLFFLFYIITFYYSILNRDYYNLSETNNQWDNYGKNIPDLIGANSFKTAYKSNLFNYEFYNLPNNKIMLKLYNIKTTLGISKKEIILTKNDTFISNSCEVYQDKKDYIIQPLDTACEVYFLSEKRGDILSIFIHFMSDITQTKVPKNLSLGKILFYSIKILFNFLFYIVGIIYSVYYFVIGYKELF